MLTVLGIGTSGARLGIDRLLAPLTLTQNAKKTTTFESDFCQFPSSLLHEITIENTYLDIL